MLLVEAQRRGLGIQQQHATGYQRHACRALFKATEGRAQVHRHPLQRRLGIGGIGPEADPFLVDEQPRGFIVHLTMATGGRQAQAAYTTGLAQQLATVTHQPLLADALFADEEQEVVATGVAEQAQPFDGEGGPGQEQRLAPLPVIVHADEHRLLAFALDGRQQQAGVAFALIEALETTGELGQDLTVPVQ